MGTRKMLTRYALGCGLLALTVGVAAAPAHAQTRTYEIEATSLSKALRAYARVSGRQIIFTEDLVRGKKAPPVRGNLSADAALDRLLAGSGLRAEHTPSGAIMIMNAAAGNVDAASKGAADTTDYAGVAEILVVGSTSQNVDIRRTEDDAQPYVVFGRKDIERSQATNLEDFLRTRLTMNTQASSSAQSANAALDGNRSNITLRGLDSRQTLVLIDGRRAPRAIGTATGGFSFLQADINGLPLSAIERIEILPATAGGIYGGDAIGGVINVIRKRDYNGLSLRAGYDGTFRGGGETFRAELFGGFSLNGGDTNISLSASYADSRPLYVGDNDLWRAGRDLILQNDPNGPLSFSGTTSNIRSQNGTNLVLKTGQQLNSNHTYVPIGYQGPAGDNGLALLANAGQYSPGLPDDIYGRQATLRNNPRVYSANLNLRHSFAPWLELYADASIQENIGRGNLSGSITNSINLAANSAANPFAQAVTVYFPVTAATTPVEAKSQSLSATGGLIARLGEGWTASAEYGWSRAKVPDDTSGPYSYNSAAFQAAVASRQIDVLSDLDRTPFDPTAFFTPIPGGVDPAISEQQIGSLRIAGSPFSLPGGPVRLTTLAERRTETAEPANQRLTSALYIFYPRRSQSVSTGYLEVAVPVVSDRNASAGLHELELQGSVRYDRYSTNVAIPGSASILTAAPTIPSFARSKTSLSSTNYLAAVRWAPTPDLSFRASYSTGFLPPAIGQLSEVRRLANTPSTFQQDPLRGNQLLGVTGPYTELTIGNPDLIPESSKSLSAGVVFKPPFAPGVRFSADYTRIRKSNEIRTLTANVLLANEAAYPGRVVRGPKLASDPANWAGPITLIDTRLINYVSSRSEAIDFQFDVDLPTRSLGTFHAYSVATWSLTSIRQDSVNNPAYDAVDTQTGPLEWRVNAGLDWELGRVALSWNTQYYSSYKVALATPNSAVQDARNILLQGSSRIPAQTYHDISGRYTFPDGVGALSNVVIAAGIQNLFDHRPPVIAGPLRGYSTYGDPRLRRFTLSITKPLKF